MKKVLILLILLLVSIGLIVGCAKRLPIGHQKVVETSGSRPNWITVIPKAKKGMMFFRGIKTRAPNLDGGLTDSRMHAARQVAEMVETKANVDYENARLEYGIPMDDKDIGTVIRDGLIMLSDAMIQGVKEKELYYEKVEEVVPEGVTYFYNCYILMTISEQDYRRIASQVINRQKAKARAMKNKKAEEFLDKMRERVMQTRFEAE
ncbi:MAG TPA: hypothetical protein ENH97_01895 [bacterium]|nr:hypothetical protein [bacterium]